MKKLLDFYDPQVVKHFNEVTLWSAPFAQLLLENVPIKDVNAMLDIGYETGFPLVELAQRLGPTAEVYGMDVWTEANQLVKEKITIFELHNIQLFETSADQIPLETESVDLVTSNLGVNNFDNKNVVYQEK